MITADRPLVVGDAVTLEVLDDKARPRSGDTVKVVHRPGLADRREVVVGTTDSLGRVRWTVDAPGPVDVLVGAETVRMHAAWSTPPAEAALLLGALLALAAGLVAWGRR